MSRLVVPFMGTAPFAVPSLRALVHAGHWIPLVVTQPDRPAGRGRESTPPAVKCAAEALGLPVWQPERIRDEGAALRLRATSPDVIVVAAYGKILPQAIFDIPRLGCVNVHGSLLPRYRGAAPVQWALYHGETETGVSIMRVEAGLDSGPVLLRRATRIEPDDDTPRLTARLAELGAEALVEAIARLAAGDIEPQRQDDAAATLAPPLRKEQAAVDWGRPAQALYNQVRAFRQWPGTVTRLGGRMVKVLKAGVLPGPTGGEAARQPGEVVAVVSEGIAVATGQGTLLLLEVQPESRRPISAVEFARGARIVSGMRFA